MFALSNLRDGQPPGIREIYDPLDIHPHEIRADTLPLDPVWDQATGRLRERTPADAMRDLQERKIREIRAGVVRDCEAIMPVYEFIYVTRARIADSRIAQLESIAKRGRDLEAYVNDPNRTEAEVEGVTW